MKLVAEATSDGLERERGVRGHQHAVLVEQHLAGRQDVPALDRHGHVLERVSGQRRGRGRRLGDRVRARSGDRRRVAGGARARRHDQVAGIVRRAAQREHLALLRRAGQPHVERDRHVAQPREQGVGEPDSGQRSTVAARERQAAPVVPDTARIAVDDGRVVALPGPVIDHGPARLVERVVRHQVLIELGRQSGPSRHGDGCEAHEHRGNRADRHAWPLCRRETSHSRVLSYSGDRAIDNAHMSSRQADPDNSSDSWRNRSYRSQKPGWTRSVAGCYGSFDGPTPRSWEERA